QMRFRNLAGVQLGSAFLSGSIGLVLALGGFGPWSLIAQTLGASVATLLFVWKAGEWQPAWSFDREACRQLFSFSAYMIANDVLNYWGRAIDRLLIGRYLGAATLGIYSRACTLMLIPLNQVSNVIGRVMFPAFSLIQTDKTRCARAYLQTIRVIAF